MNKRVELSVLAQLPESQWPSSEAPPAFEPFKWAVPGAETAAPRGQLDRMCEARDVVHGAADIMAILERMEIDKGSENADGSPVAPLFDVIVASNLQRLAITSLRLIGARLDASIQEANRQAASERGAG